MNLGRSVLGLPVRVLLAAATAAADVVGAAVVTVLALWVLPLGPVEDLAAIQTRNLLVAAGFLLVSVPLGVVWGGLLLRLPGRADPATLARRERRLVLYAPLRLATVQAVLWGAATVLFVLLNLPVSWRVALTLGETILLGGITTSAMCYLLAERLLRTAAARVLAAEPPRRRMRFGVLVRSVLFWALGTAVPVVGLILAGISALAYGDVPATQLATVLVVLGAVALAVGFLLTAGAARAVADPVVAVRRALQRVERGDLDARVPVYDGSELGLLQAGFNTMADGLRERERLRDLFGRHVGQEVARAAAAAGEIELGGEVRRVAVLFVDLVGSTEMAAHRPATDVVAVLNRFFGIVVEVVEACGGWINKFEGDAALAVFGAPVDVEDPAGRALCAARTLADRLAAEMPEARAGIGVSAGDAVAGNVGDVRRFEYTVIGDPVNEAARLTELAKSAPGGVLVAEAAVRLAGPVEARYWRLGDAVTLRGRTTPTRLGVPV